MNAREWDRAHLYQYRARLLRVIDGDTALLLVDCGFYGRHETRVRLFGIRAPELHAAGGLEAKQRLERALSQATTGEWPLRLISTQRERIVAEQTTFERYVGWIWIETPDGALHSIEAVLTAEPKGQVDP